MADSIKVSTQVLNSTATKIRKNNAAMDAALQDINKTMNNLESSWKSDAASDIRANMNALKPRFEQYKQVIESYAQFLDRTANDYEVTESTIQTNAGSFR